MKGFKKDENYTVRYLSKPMGCIATPPRIARIVHIDCFGNETEDRIGYKSPICRHCGEKWEDHEYYKK